jgi:hypothetical protein
MLRLATALSCGALFGFGIGLSQMSSPSKVLGFLDVTGRWDPSLLYVLLAAVVLTVVGFWFVRRLRRPLLKAAFEMVAPDRINGRLVVGAALFGVGWGLGGYCPGAGIVALTRLAPEAALFVGCFFLGSLGYRGYAALTRLSARKSLLPETRV